MGASFNFRKGTQNMYIYSWYRGKLIDFSRYDELRIEKFDKEGHISDYSGAVSYELRAGKHVESGYVMAYTVLYHSESYDECEELLDGILAHLVLGTKAVCIEDNGEGNKPVVNKFPADMPDTERL